MAVLSVLRPRLLVPMTEVLIMKRWAGHAKTMPIRPSLWTWRKFKDMMHLYFSLALIPIFCVTSYCSIFIGNAELAETPEGYEPEYYEYERHPITRWFCRVWHEHPGASHERRMHKLTIENEKMILKKIENNVRNIMSARGDYKAWNYEPVYGKEVRRYRDANYRASDLAGIGRANDVAEYKDPREW